MHIPSQLIQIGLVILLCISRDTHCRSGGTVVAKSASGEIGCALLRGTGAGSDHDSGDWRVAANQSGCINRRSVVCGFTVFGILNSALQAIDLSPQQFTALLDSKSISGHTGFRQIARRHKCVANLDQHDEIARS
jgi:hypothetical protein